MKWLAVAVALAGSAYLEGSGRGPAALCFFVAGVGIAFFT